MPKKWVSVTKKILKKLLPICLSIIFFLSGTAFGTYYHNEILVWWRAFIATINKDYQETTNETPLPAIPDETPTIKISKFDLTLPLVYSDTLDEPTIQEYLKEGAVVLPLGTSFGEPGNVVITAHSSGTAAFGPYRFAFAKLGEINEQEQFQITTPTATYTYRVYGKEIVWPHQVDRLPQNDKSTVTLVTCWPPWTNLQRLLVHSELENIEYHI
jgi:sortase A